MTAPAGVHATLDTGLYQAPRTSHAVPSEGDRMWTIRPVQHADVAALKVLFRKLHAFNATLDPRFALSERWETYFDATIAEALRGEALCLIACRPGTDQPYGFVVATVHHDSDMWRYHEWVEVEALYVDDAWRGCGLAEVLLTRACDWAESIGQSAVQLYVTASNEHAIRFYQHEGFGETQAVMRKVLA
ncbi:MAG TPA: GNAT family N-acetyltransferase [Ktedonobacterales bacterium]